VFIANVNVVSNVGDTIKLGKLLKKLRKKNQRNQTRLKLERTYIKIWHSSIKRLKLLNLYVYI